MSQAPSPLASIHQQIQIDLAPILGAKELRVIGIRRVPTGWTAEVEAFLRNPQLSIKNAIGEKDVLSRARYRVEFDESLALTGFTELESEV